jgi:hypothetical protein
MSVLVDASSVDRALRRWWKTIITNLEQEVRNEILRQNLIYTGELMRNIRVKTVVPKKVFRVIVDVPYASALERGRKKVYADVDELTRWAMIKKGESLEDARRSAWAIATSLMKHGIRGRYFIRKAVRSFIRRYKARTRT